MTTVVERRIDIHTTADDVGRVLAHEFADVRTLLETGRPSPAKQKTTEKFARRDHGSNVAVQR